MRFADRLPIKPDGAVPEILDHIDDAVRRFSDVTGIVLVRDRVPLADGSGTRHFWTDDRHLSARVVFEDLNPPACKHIQVDSPAYGPVELLAKSLASMDGTWPIAEYLGTLDDDPRKLICALRSSREHPHYFNSEACSLLRRTLEGNDAGRKLSAASVLEKLAWPECADALSAVCKKSKRKVFRRALAECQSGGLGPDLAFRSRVGAQQPRRFVGDGLLFELATSSSVLPAGDATREQNLAALTDYAGQLVESQPAAAYAALSTALAYASEVEDAPVDNFQQLRASAREGLAGDESSPIDLVVHCAGPIFSRFWMQFELAEEVTSALNSNVRLTALSSLLERKQRDNQPIAPWNLIEQLEHPPPASREGIETWVKDLVVTVGLARAGKVGPDTALDIRLLMAQVQDAYPEFGTIALEEVAQIESVESLVNAITGCIPSA